MQISGLYVVLDAALAASTTHVYTLRENGGDSAQTVTITAGNSSAGPSGGGVVTLGSGDTFAMKCAATLGSVTNLPHFAFLMTDPTAAAGKKFRPLMVSP